MSASNKATRTARSLPLDLWPEADRNGWIAACQPATRLKRGGAASHLKPATRDDQAAHYGNFLGSLHRCGLLGRDLPAAANVTPVYVDRYLNELKDRLASTTLHSTICRLRRTAHYIAPNRDFAWLAEIGKDLALGARPRSKWDRLVSTERLVEAGLTLIYEAELSGSMTKLARANQVRNGLMVALLALCPIRRKNFTALEIGRSFVKIRGTWWIALSALETKETRADERPIDDLLTPFIDRFLRQHRPVPVQLSSTPSALWLSARTGIPISDKQVARIIRMTTLSTVGVVVSPHLFRTAGATSAASLGSENPYLGSALLHHTHPSLTNAHYNRATSLSAAEGFRQIVRQYERT
jgi:integrase